MSQSLAARITRRIEQTSARHALGLAYRSTVGTLLILQTLMIWDATMSTIAAASPVGEVAITVLYAAILGMIVALVRATDMQPWVYTFGAIVGIVVLTLPSTVPTERTPLGYPAEMVVYGAYMAILVWGRGPARYVGAATVAAAGLIAHWQAHTAAPDHTASLWRVCLIMTITFVGTCVVVDTANRIGRSIDDSRAALHDSLTETRRAQAERLEREEFDRFLHDDILHTLRMAALADHIDAEATRAAAREVLTELDARTTVTSRETVALIDELQGLGDSSPLQIDLTLHGSIPEGLPRTVALAMLRAVQEALRNVQRHAGVVQATITLVGTSTALSVEVSDDGVGFAPDSDRRGRLGIDQSIRSRLMAVGGHATITSAPGAGTQVRLTWRDPHRARVLPRAAFLEFGDLFHTAVSTATGATLAVMLVVCFSGLSVFAHPQIQIAVAAVVVAAWAVFTPLTRRAELRWQGSALLTAIAIAAPFVAAAQLPDGYTTGWHLWMPGSPAPLTMIVIFYRPLWEGLTATVLSTGTLWTALLMTPHADAVSPPYALTYVAPLLVGAGAFVLRVTSDIAMSAADAIREKEAYAQLELDRTHIQNQVSSIRLREIAIDVQPLLTDIANRTVSPADAADRAARLEHAVRDAIISTNTTQLRRTITDLRTIGWNIDFRRSTPPHSQTPAVPEPADLIDALASLKSAPTAGHLVITLTEHPADEALHQRTDWTLLAPTPSTELRTQISTLAAQLDAHHTDDPDYIALRAAVASPV